LLPNGPALSCEPQRLRGSLEEPEFDAKTVPWIDWNELLGVSCNRLILIEAPSCAYSTRSRLDVFTKTRIRAGGRPMRFYNGTHQHWCGIDLHARTMYACILD
jgi:hypothetical protein